MDEAWERAVEAARGGEDPALVRSLTLDGALKCSQGRLPSVYLLQQFSQLRVLSIANVGLASLAGFPYLPFLERLILSDNRIAGGLEHLVQAGLKSLRDLDLSNNKMQQVQDLAPLARLNLVSLDLYECPITRIPDYRSRVFSMIESLRYLDKLDPEDNERPESDEEEDEDDVEDELGEEAEVEEDGEENAGKLGPRVAKPSGGRVINFMGTEDEDYGDEDDEREDEGEESDEVDGDATVYQEGGKPPSEPNRRIVASGSDEEGVDYDDDAENVEIQDVDESEEEVGEDDEEDGGEGEDDDDEEEAAADRASARPVRMQDEIDAQEEEDDGEDENGELVGDEEEDADEEGVDSDEEDDEDEEEYGTEYLVQPVGHAKDEEAASDFEPGEDEDEDDDIEDDDEADAQEPVPSFKRKRSKGEDGSDEDDGRPPKH